MSITADLPLAPLRLECGVQLPGLHLRLWGAGPGLEALRPLRARRPQDAPAGVVQRGRSGLETLWEKGVSRLDPGVPTVVICHALTGDAQAGGPGGWWEALVGPGRLYDTDHVRVLAFNHLGSCYGSYGPADAGFPKRASLGWPESVPGWVPAPVSVWDQARAELLALDALGVDHVRVVSGGSVGGNLALCLQVLAPERFEAVHAVACDTQSSAWALGWNHLGREALWADPLNGLVHARQIAHLSYRAPTGLEQRMGRARRGEGPWAPFAVQTYLRHHGDKLQTRFDPRAYLCMLDAMDSHDLTRRPARDPHESWSTEGAWGLGRLHDVYAVGVDSDQLFAPRALAEVAEGSGGRFSMLSSPHGHDGFLIHQQALGGLLRRSA